MQTNFGFEFNPPFSEIMIADLERMIDADLPKTVKNQRGASCAKVTQGAALKRNGTRFHKRKSCCHVIAIPSGHSINNIQHYHSMQKPL